MALTKDHGRQPVLSAKIPFTFNDLTSGEITEAIDLPGGAYIVSGEVVITTAFDSATSDAIEVGLLSGATDDLLSSTSIAATGITAIVPFAGALAATDTVTIEWTQVGGGTSAGVGFLRVDYVIDGRATDTQP
jgi:hypothetical protein